MLGCYALVDVPLLLGLLLLIFFWFLKPPIVDQFDYFCVYERVLYYI